ncbi:hypothetical protein GCM10023184_39160 [Flaviaesturariibacter amylovorans]|uniref:Uncharacterized protein n=2 Tax=Flaviaesturariibacter amylovorans TaxID=1084520 RepID=A0ABP8HM00_9BACT
MGNDGIEVSKASREDAGKHDADICNPFCTCACCGLIKTNVKGATFEIASVPFVSSFIDSYQSEPLLTVALPIWQPPQLLS